MLPYSWTSQTVMTYIALQANDNSIATFRGLRDNSATLKIFD